jgi:hypothetical protein
VKERNGPTYDCSAPTRPMYDYGWTHTEQKAKAHPCQLLRLIRGRPEKENINFSRLASEDPTNQSTSPHAPPHLKERGGLRRRKREWRRRRGTRTWTRSGRSWRPTRRRSTRSSSPPRTRTRLVPSPPPAQIGIALSFPLTALPFNRLFTRWLWIACVCVCVCRASTFRRGTSGGSSSPGSPAALVSTEFHPLLFILLLVASGDSIAVMRFYSCRDQMLFLIMDGSIILDSSLLALFTKVHGLSY